MIILILGNGGREKVIKECISSNKNHKIYLYDNKDFNKIKEFCIENTIELVIPSTEIYLCNGIVDFLTDEIKGIKVFGPTKAQARIEGSKHFSKTLMTELDIPTAKFKFFIIKEEAISYIKRFYMYLQSTSMVIKYSGLASGKGVYLPKDHDEAVKCIDELYEKNKENWEGVIIETMLKDPKCLLLHFVMEKKLI